MAKGYNLTVQLNIQGPKNLNSVVNNIQKQLSNIQANVNVKVSPQTAKALQGISQQSKQVKASADDAANAMEKFGKSAGLAVKRFGAFTAATVGFYAVTRATQQSLEKFIEYDKQITRIAQVTNSSKDSLAALSAEITNLSTSLGVSSSELASVAVTLSQAGLSAREAEKALKALALTNLAPTFNDINQTVEGSIALMKQFSISTNQLESALGSINAVAGSFAVEAGDLITAVQRAGGVFAAASQGVSEGTNALNEFLAVFTSVRATTREGAETIATGLRTIFTRLQREDTIAALEEFGVSLTDLEGKFVGPYKAIEQLSQGLRNLDPRSLQFSGIVEELGGFRQVGKVIPLIQQFTTAQQALNVAQQGSGSLARDAALGQDTLAVKISKVQQEFDALIRSIGETSEFRQFIQLSLDLASALIKVADAVKPIIPALAALGAAKVLGGVPSIARGFKKGLGFNTGGFVPGVGNTDTVEAALTPGEYVIRKAAVKAIGRDTLERVNRTGKLPEYNSGGQVEAQNLPSAYIQKKITRAGTQEEYAAGQRINARDRVNFQVESLPIDASAKIGNTEFEQRVAATLGGQWKGGNAPVDVIAPQGPVEVRNRKSFTPPAELADKLARYYGDRALQNKMQLDNINLGKIFVAYNTGKLDEKKRKSIEAEGRAKKIAPKSALKGAKKRGFDFRETFGPTKRANTGGPISGRDTVDALLTPGEYVINEKAARSLGEQTLDRLNKADKIGFNKGGAVGPVRLNRGGRPTSSGSGDVGFGALAGQIIALQSAAVGLQQVFGDTSASGAAASAAAQGFASSISLSITAIESLKAVKPAVDGFTKRLRVFAKRNISYKGTKAVSGAIGNVAGAFGKILGPAAVIATGLAAAGSAAASYANAQREFENKIANEKLSSSLDGASKALDNLSKGTAGAISTFNQSLLNAAQSANTLRENQNQYQYSVVGTSLDFLGNISGTGADQQTRTTQSRILAEDGLSAYFRSIFDADVTQAAQQRFEDKDRQAAARSGSEIANLQKSLGESIISRGGSIDDVIRNLDKTDTTGEIREAMARSNIEVAKRLDRTTDEGQRKDIINAEVKRQLREGLAGSVADRNARQAKTESDMLQVMFSKLFNSMEQSFKVVASNTESRFARASDALSASLGKTRIGYDNTAMKNVLENPKAFSDAAVESSIKKATPLLGDKGDRIGQLALASTRIEDDAAAVTDRILSSGKQGGVALKAIGVGIRNMFSGMNLGADVERAIDQQLSTAFTKAQGELGEGATDTQIRERVQEIVSELPQFKGALEAITQAFNTFSSAQGKYSQAVQQITEAVLQQREYLNRAADIRREGALRLRETRGEKIGLNDIIRNTMAGVAQQTGGETNIDQLFQTLQRGLKQREQIVERRDAISGDVSRNEEFKKLTQSLAELDIQLAQNRAGLELLANSTDIAQAALGRITEIQARAQEKLDFGEKLVTSTPEELMGIQQTYSDLQNILSGGELTLQNSFAAQRAMYQTAMQGGSPIDVSRAGNEALANQRGNVLSLLKEMKAFFPDNKAFNEQYRTVLQSFLEQRGLMNEQFAQAFAEAEGTDTETQRAIAVYNRAIDMQDKANTALGNLIQPFNTLAIANNSLEAAINNLSNKINQISVMSAQAPQRQPQQRQPQQRQPIRRQSGGVVYANEGQYIEMKPKGTDTVPAMLTEGEFVVNAKATKKHRGLLEHLNNGGRPSINNGVVYAESGGPITGFDAAAYSRYTGYNPDFNRDQAYLYYRYMYKQMYGLGAQQLIPIQVQRQIKLNVLREEQRQAYLAREDTQKRFTDLYEKAKENRETYFANMGRKTPEQVKKELLDSIPEKDVEKRNAIRAIYDPAKIYNLAKNRGLSVNTKAADDSIAARRKANIRKREERERERATRQAEQSPGIVESGKEKLAVPAGPVISEGIETAIRGLTIKTPKPGTSEFDSYEGVGTAPKYGTEAYKSWEQRKQARIDAELKQLGPKPKFGTPEYNTWKSNEYTIEHRESAAARAASKREREQFYEARKREIDERAKRESAAAEERAKKVEQARSAVEKGEKIRQERDLKRGYTTDEMISEARMQAGITTPTTEQKFLRFVRDREAGLLTTFYQAEYSSEEIQSLRDKYPKEFEKHIIRPKSPAKQPTQAEKNQNALDDIRSKIAAQNPRTQRRIKSRRGTTTPIQGSGRKESLDDLAAFGVGAAENFVPTLVAAAAVGLAPVSGGSSLGLLATLGIGGAAGYATSLAQDAALQSVAPDIYEQKEEIKQRSPGMALAGGFFDPAAGRQLFKPGQLYRAFAKGAAQREAYNATRLAQQNQVFRSFVSQGVEPDIVADRIRAYQMTGDQGFLGELSELGEQARNLRSRSPTGGSPGTFGAGEGFAPAGLRPSAYVPETYPNPLRAPYKPTIPSPTKAQDIPEIVKNSGLADVWPNLSPRAQKAALKGLKTSENAAAARAAKATPKPKITAEDPGKFIGPTPPQGKAPPGRRIEIDPTEFGFSASDFTTRAIPVSRGIPVGAKPIPESGLTTTSSKAAAKPTRPKPQISTGATKRPNELENAKYGFGLLNPEQEFQAVVERYKPAAIISGLTDAQKEILLKNGLDYAPNPGFVKGGVGPDSNIIGPTANIERIRLLARNVREDKIATTASRRALGRELGYTEDATELFNNPNKPDLETIQNRIRTGGDEALAQMLDEAKGATPKPTETNARPQTRSAAQEILLRSDRDEAKRQLIMFKERLNSKNPPKSFAEAKQEVALKSKPLTDTEQAFMDEFKAMPRELDKFRTYQMDRGGQGYVGDRVGLSKGTTAKINAETDARYEQLKRLETAADELPKRPTKRVTIDEESDLIEVLGPDPSGRVGGIPLYQIPRSLVKNPEELLKEFTKRGYQRFSSGGIVKPKYLSSGGLAASDFQALAEGTDRYPAMLSRGEMVMNPEATRRNKGLLKALNRSRGGMVKNGITYAADGTNGGIGVSAAGNGELRITGNVNVTPGAIPAMPQPPGGATTADPTPTLVSAIRESSQSSISYLDRIASILSSSTATNPAASGPIGASMPTEGFSALSTSMSDLITALGSVASSISANSTLGSNQIAPGSEAPKMDFSQFANSVASFGSFASPLLGVLQTLSTTDFGVINTGAQNLNTSAQNLGASFSRFNTAVNNFSEQTNEFVNKIIGLQINGTINVQGTITMQPLQVDIAGLETLDTKLAGLGSLVINTVATALQQDNPGMNTSALRASAITAQ